MLKEKSFFGIENWKLYNSEEIALSELNSFKIKHITQENQRDYIVLFQETQLENKIQIECFKKHISSILKYIIIGRFSLPQFQACKSIINELINQTNLLEKWITKPEFKRYSLQKKLYFNLE
jgi:hypothetical protein